LQVYPRLVAAEFKPTLGQALFDPPNVAGWAGGRTWITPATLLQRGNLFRDVLFPDVKAFRPADRTMPVSSATLTGPIALDGLAHGLWRAQLQWASGGRQFYAEREVNIP
jgi:hypothetical protein